jgi:alpha-methylacyl-CoA racemase
VFSLDAFDGGFGGASKFKIEKTSSHNPQRVTAFYCSAQGLLLMEGPLSGLRIVALGGLGPAPLASMLLADHGAEVIRIERKLGTELSNGDTMLRSQKMVVLDLKQPDDVMKFKELIKTADGLIDPYRPGAAERLGIGPDVLLADNPRLVFGRMTGWGQTGPMASCAGHDINYISLSGALAAIGPKERPIPPLPLVGDMGGGGMFLAFSMTAALLHAQRTGQGQVIDCAMTEGAGLLMTAFYELYATGGWELDREANFLDGGAHYYNTYKTADDQFVSIGPLEPQFYTLLLDKLGLTDPDFDNQQDHKGWPRLKSKMADLFLTRTRSEWCELLEMTDVCFAPVLSMSEAPDHAHAVARGSFVTVDGVVQPAPAPHYSGTALAPPRSPKYVDIETLLVKPSTEPESSARA